MTIAQDSYFVFATEEAALTAAEAIADRGRTLAAGSGLTVDDEGSIVGVRRGVSDPSRQRTERWDEPKQRLDGQWVVAHPACLPIGDHVPPAAGGMTVAEYMAQDVGVGATVERFDPSWFPAPVIGGA